MAQQQPQDPSTLSPTRYSERRVPQFVGGDIDPSTGNLILGTKQQAGGNTQPTPGLDSTPSAISDAANLTPATPTTRLGSAGNGTDFGDLAKSIGTSVAASAIGKGIGNAFSSGGGSGTGQPAGSSSPNLPNAGGFATGGGNDSSSTLTANSGSQSVDEGGFTAAYNPPASSSSFDEAGFSAPAAAPAPSYSAPAPSAPPPSGGFDSGGDDSSGGDGTGSVICTELHRQGLLVGDTFEADQTFGAMVKLHHPDVYAGYIVWARHVVKAMKRSKRVTRFVNWGAAPWANYMAIRHGRNGFPSIRGVVTFHVGWALCATIGAGMAAWRRGARVTRDVLAA